MEAEIEKLRKSIKAYKAVLTVVVILLIMILAIMCVGGWYMYNLSQQLIPLARKFTEIDWTRLFDQVLKVDPFEVRDQLNSLQSDLSAVKESLETISSAIH